MNETKIKDRVDVIRSMMADEGYWMSAQGDVLDGGISINVQATGEGDVTQNIWVGGHYDGGTICVRQ